MVTGSSGSSGGQRLSLADYVRGPGGPTRAVEQSRASTPSRRTVLKMLPVDFVCAGQWRALLPLCYHSTQHEGEPGTSVPMADRRVLVC